MSDVEQPRTAEHDGDQPQAAEGMTSEELDQRADELAREGNRRWMEHAADTMRELANDPARLAEIERRIF